MPKVTRKLMKESGAGKLYEANGFLVLVLTGSPTEMGVQYGGLMVEYMQKAYDLLVAPGRKKGMITDDTAKSWTERIYTTGSIRYRQFYDGRGPGQELPRDHEGRQDLQEREVMTGARRSDALRPHVSSDATACRYQLEYGRQP